MSKKNKKIRAKVGLKIRGNRTRKGAGAISRSRGSGKGNTRSKEKSKPISKKKLNEREQKVAHLVLKGKERKFLTQDEILKEFPTIEDDIDFLDSFYNRLNKEGIDVVESGSLLESEDAGVSFERGSPKPAGSSFDSIQMYLKEIGKYPLISGSEEKILAKRILAGDNEARNLLAKSNLRLVVSIAKKYV